MEIYDSSISPEANEMRMAEVQRFRSGMGVTDDSANQTEQNPPRHIDESALGKMAVDKIIKQSDRKWMAWKGLD